MGRLNLSVISLFIAIWGFSGSVFGCPSVMTIDVAPNTTVNVGQTVTFTAVCTSTLQDYEWIFPSAAYGISGQGTNQASCKFNPSGQYLVKLRYKFANYWFGPASATITVNAVSDPWYVKPDGDNLNNGRSWTTAFQSIQTAINSASPGHEIIVAEGIYRECIGLNGKDLTIHSTDPNDRSVVENTILNGQGQGAVIFFEGSETSACHLQGITVTGGGNYCEDLLTQSLEGHWKLDETAGNSAPDSSGYGHTGTLLPAGNEPVWISEGRINGGLYFNGSNYVQMNGYYGISGTQPRTTCAWIKLSYAGSGGNILSYGGTTSRSSWLFMVNESNKLQLGVNSGNIIGDPVLVANRWYHVTAALDDWNGDGLKVNDLRLYIDGERISGTYTNPSEALNTGDYYPVRMGTNIFVSTFFRGMIDDTRLYSRALSESEIRYLALQPGNVAHWKLDETAGTTATDSVNGNHANLINGPVWQPTSGHINGALQFDGQNDYAKSPFVLNPASGPFSAFAWVQGTADSGYGAILSQEEIGGTGRYWMQLSGGSENCMLATQLRTLGGSSLYYMVPSGWDDSMWYHVGVVWDGQRRHLYLNGAEVAQDGTAIGSLESCTGGMLIGTNKTYTVFFDGKIDDVRMYDRAVTDAEIHAIYSQGEGLNGNSAGASISQCIIRENESPFAGGGIWNVDGSITNCFILNNKSEANGGGLADCDGLIANCVIAGNEAASGGALSNCDGDVINCSIVNNTTLISGILDQCNGNIINCILWDNTGIPLTSSVFPVYSCYPGGSGSNVDADPLFRSPFDLNGPDETWGTEDDGLVLQPGSPCIDTGSNPGVPSFTPEDITGRNRYLDGDHDETDTVDMGAYETPRIWYVDCDVTSSGDGKTWATAKKTIQEGINVSQDGDVVLVADGVYTGGGYTDAARNRDLDFYDSVTQKTRAITVRSLNGPPTCIIDCQGSSADPHRGFYFHSDEGPDSLVSGFTIQGGYVNSSHPKPSYGNGSGGAIACGDYIVSPRESASPMIMNCIFRNNYAEEYGGGLFCVWYSHVKAVNNIFVANKTNDNGGGMYVKYYSNAKVNNCTFTMNHASISGGGLYVFSSSPELIEVKNSIFWKNTRTANYYTDYQIDGNLPTVSSCCVQGGYTQGTEILNADPNFVREPYDGGDGWGIGSNDDYGNLHLQEDSPCIDAGINITNPSLPPMDLEGKPRRVDDLNTTDTGLGSSPLVDMGAFEYSWEIASVLYVDDDAPADLLPGVPDSNHIEDGSEQYPYDAIQQAVNAAVDGTMILIKAGTYTGGTGPNPERNRDITITKSITIMGEDRDHCILNCEGAESTPHRAFKIDVNQNPLLEIGPCTFINLTIQNGYSPNESNIYGVREGNTSEPSGGGIFISGYNSTGYLPDIEVQNCRFTGNKSGYWGGAIYSKDTNLVLNDCVFENNESWDTGGAVYVVVNDAEINNCVFIKNKISKVDFPNEVGGSGAALWAQSSQVTVDRCLIKNNIANMNAGGLKFTYSTAAVSNTTFLGNATLGNSNQGGGAVQGYDSQTTLLNCLFAGNRSDNVGGAVFCSTNSSMNLVNCTFGENVAITTGGGIKNVSSESCTVRNSIFWNNRDVNGAGSTSQISGDNITVSYSCIDSEDLFEGPGNINQDPLFKQYPSDGGDGWGDDPSTTPTDESVNDVYGDLSFYNSCSPCIDAADSTAIALYADRDINGAFRFIDDPYSDDTGLVQAPYPGIADMGAYEFPDTQTLGINQPPYARNDVVTGMGLLYEFNILNNDCDPESNDIDILEIVTPPAYGDLTEYDFETGQITYLSDSGEGPDSFSYKAIDSLGNVSNIAVVSIYPEPLSDVIITVDAGQDREVLIPAGESTIQVSLEGTITVSHPSVIVTPLWQCVYQPLDSSVVFIPSGSETTEDPTIELDTAGSYVLKLKAQDGEETRGSDQIIITVGPDPANLLPQVNAGVDDNAVLSTPYYLNATVTDDGRPNGIVSSIWSLFSYEDPSGILEIEDAMAYFENETSADTTVTFSQAGSYTLKLAATDGSEDVSGDLLFIDDLVEIHVADDGGAVNTSPYVNAGTDRTITPYADPDYFIIDAVVTDDGLPTPPGSLTYQWRVESGPAAGVLFSDPEELGRDPMTLLQPKVTFSLPGDYIFELTASDSSLSKSDKVYVAVNELSSGQIELEAEPDQQWIQLYERAYWTGQVTYIGTLIGGDTVNVQVKWSVIEAPDFGTVRFDQDSMAFTLTESETSATFENAAIFSRPGTYKLRVEAGCGLGAPVVANVEVVVLPGAAVSAASGRAILLTGDSSVYVSGRNRSSTNVMGINLEIHGCTFKPVNDNFYQDTIGGLDAFIQMEGSCFGGSCYVMDGSGQDYHGKLINFDELETIWVTKENGDAINGGAVQFDGINDYIDLRFSIHIGDGVYIGTCYGGITGSQERTCMAWTRVQSGDSGTILAWGFDTEQGNDGKRWDISVTSNGRIRVDVDKESYVYVQTTESGFNDGNWHHVAATLKDENQNGYIRVEDIRLFVDGVQKSTTTNNGSMNINTYFDEIYGETPAVQIGARTLTYGTQSNFFKGVIDEVRIYRNVLSLNEIQSLMYVLENDSLGVPGETEYINPFGQTKLREDVNFYEDPADYLKNIEWIAAGYISTLAVDIDEKLWAWGGNTHGQLGVGEAEQGRYFITPVPVSSPDLDGDGDSKDDEAVYGGSQLKDIVRISTSKFGFGTSFAVDREGQAYTWGANEDGQLGVGGDPLPDDVFVPRQVSSPDLDGDGDPADDIAEYGSSTLKDIIDVDAGTNHSIACDRSGRAWAWGRNYYGQVGNGRDYLDYSLNTERESVPVPVLAPDLDGDGDSDGQDALLYGSPYLEGIVDVSASMYLTNTYSCGGLGGGMDPHYYGNSYAVDRDGHLWSWGDNYHGQLGVGQSVSLGDYFGNHGYSVIPLRVFCPYTIFSFDCERNLLGYNYVDDTSANSFSLTLGLGSCSSPIVLDDDQGQVLEFDAVDDYKIVMNGSYNLYPEVTEAQSRTVAARIKTTKTGGDILWWGNNAGFSCTAQNQSLMQAHWKFDESSGGRIINSIPDVYNGSAGEANGTLMNGALVVPSLDPARFGKGLLYLDGTNQQYVEIDDTYKGAAWYNPITIAAWIKMEDGASGTILSWGADTTPNTYGTKWVVSVTSAGKLRLDVDANNNGYVYTNRSGLDLTDGQWHHIAVSYDGGSLLGQIKLYVDGESESTASNNSSMPLEIHDTQTVKIGAEQIGGTITNYFTGYIEDVRIYSDSSLQVIDIESLAIGGQLWRMRIYDPNGIGTSGVLRLDVGLSEGYIYGTTNIADGNWHHVAAVLPEGTANVENVELYVDGQIEESVSSDSCEINTVDKCEVQIEIRVGGGNLEREDYFEGRMDDIQLYKRQLDPNEIMDLCTVSASVAPMKDVIAVSAGGAHVLALDSKGSVWSWGALGLNMTGGALGLGPNASAPYMPRQVLKDKETPLTDIVSIDAGFDISFAVDRYGRYWAWGESCSDACCCNGELGVGDYDVRTYATPIHLQGVLNTRIGAPEGWYPAVQPAVDEAINGDELIVFPGRYVENVLIDDKNILIRSSDPMDWNIVKNTIIDGSKRTGAGCTVQFLGNNNSSVLAGFTVLNGVLNPYGGSYLCGILCSTNTSPTITNNIITENEYFGIRCQSSTSPIIKNNVIYGHEMIELYDDMSGTGIYLSACNGTAIIHNNTIVNNGRYGIDRGNEVADIKGNIIWGNSLGNLVGSGSVQLFNNCIGGYSSTPDGNGNFGADPLFIDAESGDYHIQPNSPCINKGYFNENPHVLFPDFSFKMDIDNQSRVSGGQPDIGADEVQLLIVEAGEDKEILVNESLAFVDAYIQSMLMEDPGALSVEWSMVSGPEGGTAVFDPDDKVKTSATFDRIGTYVLKLQLYEDTDPVTFDTVTIQVQAGVTASLSDSQILREGTAPPFSTIDIYGDIVDDAEGLTEPQWIQVMTGGDAFSDERVTFGDSQLPDTTVTFPGTGIYKLMLLAEKNNDVVGSDALILVVDPAHVSVNAGADQTIPLGESAYLNVTVSGSDAALILFEELSSPDGGQAQPDSSGTLDQFTIDFTAPGEYLLAFIAVDGSGNLLGADTVKITVVDPQVKVDAGVDQTIKLPARIVYLNGSVEGADALDLTTEWIWGGDAGLVTFSNTGDLGTSVRFNEAGSYNGAGIYKIGLVVKDGAVVAGLDFVTITVNPVSGVPVDIPTLVDVDAGEYDDLIITIDNCGLILDDSVADGAASVEWSCGQAQGVTFVDPEGTEPNPETLLHPRVEFTEAGTYILSLLARNGGGDILGYDTTRIVVTKFKPSITASLSAVDIVKEGQITLPTNVTYVYGSIENGWPGITTVWSDPDGIVQFEEDASLDTKAKFPHAGIYWLFLEAYYNEQVIASDAVQMRVGYPVVTVEAGGPGIILTPAAGSVEAELVDSWIKPEGVYTPYWTQLGGPATVSFDPGNNPPTTSSELHPTATLTQPGSYTLLLSAMDGGSNIVGSDTVTIVASIYDDQLVVYAGGSKKVMLPDGAADVDLEFSDACVLGIYDGLFWEKVEGPGDVTFDSGANPPSTTTAAFDAPGPYVLKLTATNSSSGSSASDTVSVLVYPENQALVVEAGGPYPDVVLPAGLYLDEAWILGWIPGTLTTQWSMVTGPEGASVSFSPSDSLEKPVACFSEPGNYTLKLTAYNEGDEVAGDTVDITVHANPNDLTPPVVTIGTIPSDLSGTVTGQIDIVVNTADNVGMYRIELVLDDGEANERVLDVIGTSFPYPPALQMQYTLHTETLSNGDHTLIGRAMDSSGNSNVSNEVEFTTANSISEFEVTPELATHNDIVLNFTATLTQSAWTLTIDPGGMDYPRSGTGTEVDELIDVVNDLGLATDGTDDGPYTARLTSGAESADLTFLVMFNQPIAQIDNLSSAGFYDVNWNINTNVDRVPIVSEGKFELKGKATHSSQTLWNDIYYKLEVFNKEIQYYDLELSEWKNEVGYILKNVTPGILENGFCKGHVETSFGELDFTSLPNGIYQLLLTVNCHDIESYANAEFVLDCPLKLGNVQFSQEDIAIPVGGVPLRIIRTYNSLNRHRDGDFGYGWEYSIANLDIKLNEMREDMPGGWTRRVGGDFDRDVTLTLPDGKRVTFTFGLEFVDSDSWKTVYSAPEGVKAEFSVAPDCPFELRYGGGLYGVDYYWYAEDALVPTIGQVDLSYQDIAGFTLKTEDGTIYNIKRELYGEQVFHDPITETTFPYYSYGKPYVASVLTASGERIEFAVNTDDGENPQIQGVEYYEPDGVNFVKSIYIQYSDEDSRHIEAIYPPSELDLTGQPKSGAVPYVKYAYDDYGNLRQVHALENRDAAIANPENGYIETTYVYKDPDNLATHERNHYIYGIQDERGITPIRYEYDDSGRLIATIDARGNRIELDHDSDYSTGFDGVTYQNPEAVTDRSGVTTYYFYDKRGNVTLQQDGLGHLTAYAFEDMVNPDSPTKVSTLVPDPADPENSVFAKTWTRYEKKGRPVFTCDPAYNVITTVYDDLGNVLQSTQWKPIDPNSVTEPSLNLPYMVESEFVEISTTRNYYTDNNLPYLTGTTTTNPDQTLNWHSISLMYYTSTTPKNLVEHGIQINTDLLQFEDLFAGTPEFAHLRDQSYFDANLHPKTSCTYNQTYSGSPDQPYSTTSSGGLPQYSAYDEDNRQIASWHYWDDPATSGQNPDKYILNVNEMDSQGRSIRSLQISEDVTVHDPAADLSIILSSVQNLIDAGDAVVLSETQYNSTGQTEYAYSYTGRRDEAETYDLYGTSTYYKYNELGNVAETWSGTFTYQYDKATSALLASDYEWLTVSQTLYDADGRTLVTVGPYDYTDPAAEPVGTETVYDDLGRAVEMRRWENVAISFETYKINEEGEKVLEGEDGYTEIQSDPITSIPDDVLAGNAWEGTPTCTLAWTADGLQPVVDANSMLSYSHTLYDSAGRMQMSISLDEDGYEQPTSYEYDLIGRQMAVIDPLGHECTWDANGRLLTADSDPALGLGHRTETYYDGIRKDYVIDAEENMTSFLYDPLGRVVTTIHPPADFYDDAWYEYPDTLTYTHSAYDGLGRQVWETSGMSLHTNVLEGPDADPVPENEKKYYAYDITGRLTQVTLPEVQDPENSNTWTNPSYNYIYDDHGNHVGILDPLNRLTVFQYDHFGRQTNQYMPFVIDGERTSITDAEAVHAELVIALASTDPPAVEQREYAVDGRLYKVTDYKNQVTYYAYTALGQIEYERHYASDAAYDPAHPTYNSVPEIAYTYDALGQKETETVTEYDAAGTGTEIYAAQYAYDNDGRLHIIKSPQGVIEYLYSAVTAQKSAIQTYDASTSIEDIIASTATVLNRTEYGYDELTRLEDVTVDIRNEDNSVNENAHYSYTQVGSRIGLTLPNGIHTRYEYDERNLLKKLTHFESEPVLGQPEPGFVSKYEPYRQASGMQVWVTEDGVSSEIHDFGHDLDNLNRVSHEYNYGYSGYSYETSYIYDLVGNRKQRSILLYNNSGLHSLETEYQYYAEKPGTIQNPDRLWKEITTAPIAAIPHGENQRIYAYAAPNGGLRYQLPYHKDRIGQFRAFWIGLPSIWNPILLYALLLLIPLVFFWPVLVNRYSRLRGSIDPLASPDLKLWHRCLCIFFAYIFLIGPDCFQMLSNAAVEFSQLSTLSWGQGNTTVEYDYDANGSLASKVTRQTGIGDITEEITYAYNLQNRLEQVTTTPYTEGVADDTVSMVRYTYNPQGIRVSKHTWTETSGTSNNDDVYTDYLIDPANPTGYAQVLEEMTVDGTSMVKTQYVLGDDVISQSKSDWTWNGVTESWDLDTAYDPQYLLYDGHGSTRQLVRPDQSVIDSYSYDGYGVLLQNNSMQLQQDPGVVSPQETSLLYAGEMFDFNNQHSYNRARWYNPANGLFNRLDPYSGDMQDPQSLHKYAYCHANPVNMIDPSGEFTLAQTSFTLTLVAMLLPALNLLGWTLIACSKGEDEESSAYVLSVTLSGTLLNLSGAYPEIGVGVGLEVSNDFLYIKSKGRWYDYFAGGLYSGLSGYTLSVEAGPVFRVKEVTDYTGLYFTTSAGGTKDIFKPFAGMYEKFKFRPGIGGALFWSPFGTKSFGYKVGPMINTTSASWGFTASYYWEGPFRWNRRILDFLNRYVAPPQGDTIEEANQFSSVLQNKIENYILN